jgi:LysR family glycine cleavage system transcriptional activator
MTANRLPPLNWLRSFEAAARHLSFTAAAEELNITQSAVSQQVKLLEHHLGQALFLRRPRSLRLTDAGRNYLPSVTSAFKVLTDGTEMFLAPRRESTLEVKANTAFTVFWLLPRIGAFLAAEPWVRLNLSTAFWTADFAGSQASVEIRYGRGEWEGEPGERLLADRTYPVCAPEVAARLASPRQLADETLIHVTQLADSWDHWAEAQGLAALKRRGGHYVNTYVASLDMAKRGLGVALGHDLLCGGLIEDGALTAPFDLAVPTQDNYYLVVPDRGEMNEAARAFRDWVLGQFG